MVFQVLSPNPSFRRDESYQRAQSEDNINADATTVKHVDGDSGGGSASDGTKGSSSSIVPLLLVSFSGFLFSIEGLSAKVVIKVSTCP